MVLGLVVSSGTRWETGRRASMHSVEIANIMVSVVGE